MKITLLAVGRLRSKPLREVCDDYLARLARFGPAELREVKAAESVTPEKSVSQECARILEALEPGNQVCVLDERGGQVSSTELCALLTSHEMRGTKRLVFILGGAYGLNEDVRKRGKLISLSRLTLPHELCRALILEQLYRARTIQHGQPYHHG